MSQLTKFLKARIEELAASVEAQTTERTAYERVLQMELAKEGTPAERHSVETPVQTKAALTPNTQGVDLTGVKFAGNKAAFVVAIVKAHGAAGAAPKEIREVFAMRKIPLSENLIYTTLSALAKEKKLQRRDGRYYGGGSVAVPKSGNALPVKRKISPAGIKRIIEANKKRWAAKKAADRAAAK
jgi:hypothetical protein